MGWEIKKRKTESDRGRGGIANVKRVRFSRRALDGSLGIEKKRCPYCAHHKAFSKGGGYQCTRCKRWFH
jgi:tRNA(Ile2) C34 agmatinyltransferase TiaS